MILPIYFLLLVIGNDEKVIAVEFFGGFYEASSSRLRVFSDVMS